MVTSTKIGVKMTTSEEIRVCEACQNLTGYERLETKVKPYVAFNVENVWKPHNVIKVLFIAESPPWDRKGLQSYFYNNSYPKKAGLRREVLKHLNLEKLESFKDEGYFLIDAIKCRLNKNAKPNVPSAILKNCSLKFLSREITELKPKIIFILGNSAKKAMQGLSKFPDFLEFKELINFKVSEEFDKVLSSYRVILCVYPGGQTRQLESCIKDCFSKIAKRSQFFE